MYKHLKYTISIITVALLLTSVACSKHETKIEAEDYSDKEKVKVEVTTPQLNEYTEPFSISGTIKAHNKTVLASKLMGQIIDILVEEGSKVKGGELLLKIDDRETKINLASLEAEAYKLHAAQEELNTLLEELQSRIKMLFHDQEKFLSQQELAQATYDRYSKLYDREVITQQEFDEIKTKLDEANSVVAKSQAEYSVLMSQKKQLDAKSKQIVAEMEQNKAAMAGAMVSDSYTEITSPLNGYVIRKHVNVGDMAKPGQSLLELEDPDNMYLEVFVDESNAFMFKPGSEVKVLIDAFGNTAIPCKIRELVPSASPESHTFKVKIDIPSHKLIHSGLYARVVLPVGGKNIFIPHMAIVKRGQIVGVYVVNRQNVARFRIIKTGQDIQGYIEVLSGLTENDKVIINKLDKISDGTKVVVLGEK